MAKTANLVDRHGRVIGSFRLSDSWRVVEYNGVAYSLRDGGAYHEDTIIHITDLDRVKNARG